MVSGAEKFTLWKARNGYTSEDICAIIHDDVSATSISHWCRGNASPKPRYKKRLYEWSRRVSPKGKYSLTISINDWRVYSYINVYCGEALKLWRRRNAEISTRDFAVLAGCSHTTIVSIENGEFPTDVIADKITAATSGFLVKEHWVQELKSLNNGEIDD